MIRTTEFTEKWLFSGAQNRIDAEIAEMKVRHDKAQHFDETILFPPLAAVVFALAFAVYELTGSTYPAWF